MEPLAATADALDLLSATGDDGPRTRVAWIPSRWPHLSRGGHRDRRSTRPRRAQPTTSPKADAQMIAPFVLCRVAYKATDQDPTTRDRRLKDFPAETMTVAERNARRWAVDRNRQRSVADRARWPWVLERWDATERSWAFVSDLG